MTLWRLQALIILAFLLVCWGVANFPTVRSQPKLKEMCARAVQDDLSRGACEEFTQEDR